MSFNGLKWAKRASIAYMVGVWTMFGSYGIYWVYLHRNDPPVQMPKVEEDLPPNVKKYQMSNFSATVVYKENFVPYSTRLMNLFRKEEDSSSEPQTKGE